MATKIWRGDAPAIFDLWTFVPAALGGPPTSNTFTVTINGKSVRYVAVVSDTVASVAFNLAALCAASTIPEFGEYLWAANGSITTATLFTATANTAGIPGTISSSASNGGGAGAPTLTATNTTPASGPNFIDLAANWTGGLPATGDNVVFQGSSNALYYHQNTPPAIVTPATISSGGNWTGTIGLPEVNSTSTKGIPYQEYRPTYINHFCQSADATNTLLSVDSPSSGRIKFNFNDGQWTTEILAVGNPIDTGLPAIRLLGTNTLNSIQISNGSIGLAVLAGEISNYKTLGMSPQNANSTTGPSVVIGTGATMTAGGTIIELGGILTVFDSEIQDWQSLGGVAYIYGQHPVSGTWTLNGGKVYYCSSGQLSVSIGPAGTLDCSQDSRARVCEAMTLAAGATVNDPSGSMARGGFTTGIDFSVGANLSNVNLNLGTNVGVTVDFNL